MLAAAEVTGECPPVLQMVDAVLDADPPGGMCLALPFVYFLVPVWGVLHELAMWWRHHAPAGLSTETL